MKKIVFVLLSFIYIEASDFKALLFNGNCTTCHFIDEDKSAPSMKKVQTMYKKAFPNKKDFVNYMYTWVKHPNKQGSLLLEEIQKHELMPEIYFDDDTLKQIIEYIYDLDYKSTKKQIAKLVLEVIEGEKAINKIVIS